MERKELVADKVFFQAVKFISLERRVKIQLDTHLTIQLLTLNLLAQVWNPLASNPLLEYISIYNL